MADMDECRAKLPIWGLFSALGLQGADKVGAWGGGGGEAKICSPFREDNSPSFSVFTRDGVGLWKDHGTGEGGDEIKLIEAARGIPTKEAMQLYCELGRFCRLLHRCAFVCTDGLPARVRRQRYQSSAGS